MVNNDLELMIDIETLDVTPKAVVLSVGAVPFTQEYGANLNNVFYEKLQLQEQLDIGRSVSESTLIWWMERDSNIRLSQFNLEGRTRVANALLDLAKFSEPYGNIWANGPMFDIIILEDLARDYHVFDQIPWMFYQTRDVRTIKDEAGLERGWQPESIPDKLMKGGYGLHHPVTDCYIQIEAVREARGSILKV